MQYLTIFRSAELLYRYRKMACVKTDNSHIKRIYYAVNPLIENGYEDLLPSA